MELVNLFSIYSPSGDGEGVAARSRSGVWLGEANHGNAVDIIKAERFVYHQYKSIVYHQHEVLYNSKECT